MALTQQEWFDKLKSWVPGWYFSQDQEVNVARFQALAKLLATAQEEAETNVDRTFIDRSVGSYLDLLGKERTVDRIPGETDPSYRLRIKRKSLISQCAKPSLLALINELLIVGNAAIKEDWEGPTFCDRDAYFNRGEVILDLIENTFTVVVDKQLHAPYSFMDREFFADREDYVGTTESSQEVFEQILRTVNENKAFGTLYRIIERLE